MSNEVNEVVAETTAQAGTAETAAKVETPSKLKELMEVAGIVTLVPLAKAVNVAPQQLYSRKDKKTNTFKYASIESYLLKNGEGKTIEEIVEIAKTKVNERAAKSTENAAKKSEKKAKKEQEKQEKLAIFAPGSRVKYTTYRVRDGIREDYDVTATVKEVGEDQIILVRDSDNAESTMAKTTASKKLSLVTE